MNSRWLWNSHQRHKFLRAEASRDILSLLSLRNGISSGFQEAFSTMDAILFYQNTRNTGNSAVEMLQAFDDIAKFERLTGLNLFKYAFNVIQNWNTDALHFYLRVLIFC